MILCMYNNIFPITTYLMTSSALSVGVGQHKHERASYERVASQKIIHQWTNISDDKHNPLNCQYYSDTLLFINNHIYQPNNNQCFLNIWATNRPTTMLYFYKPKRKYFPSKTENP